MRSQVTAVEDAWSEEGNEAVEHLRVVALARVATHRTHGQRKPLDQLAV